MYTINTPRSQLVQLLEAIKELYNSISFYLRSGDVVHIPPVNALLLKLGAIMVPSSGSGSGTGPQGPPGKDGIGLPTGFSYKTSTSGKLQLLQGDTVISEQDARGTWMRTGVTTGVGSLHLGDAVSIGSAGNGVVFVNHESDYAMSPLWEGISHDGEHVIEPCWRGWVTDLTWAEVGTVDLGQVKPMQYTVTFPDNYAIFNVAIKPAETYTGKMDWVVVSDTGIELGRVTIAGGCTAGTNLAVPLLYPLFVRKGLTRTIRIEKADGNLLQAYCMVKNGTADIWRSATTRKWKECKFQVKQWDNTAVYAAGEQVMYRNLLWTATGITYPSSAFQVLYWMPTLSPPYLYKGPYVSSTIYWTNDIVWNGDALWLARYNIAPFITPNSAIGQMSQQWEKLDGHPSSNPRPIVWQGALDEPMFIHRGDGIPNPAGGTDPSWWPVKYNGMPFNTNWDLAYEESTGQYWTKAAGWYAIDATLMCYSGYNSSRHQVVLQIVMQDQALVQDAQMADYPGATVTLKCHALVYLMVNQMIRFRVNTQNSTDFQVGGTPSPDKCPVSPGSTASIIYMGA